MRRDHEKAEVGRVHATKGWEGRKAKGESDGSPKGVPNGSANGSAKGSPIPKIDGEPNTQKPEARGQRLEAIDQKPEKEGTREVALVPSDWPTDWFDQFWKKYPNKVDPKGSKKKLAKAGNDGIAFKTIMDGLDRYVAKTDDRPWLNPTTFINQSRWNEETVPNGKAKTGGSIIDALREQAAFFDQQAIAERAALDDLEPSGDDVLGLPAE
jgi:hypothetical protein